jgi:hypothetical protein
VTRRGAIVVALVALAVLVLHAFLVRAMAHGHVAHVLLGSGNAAPPLGAALLAVSLVVARVAAVVLVPGALLASLASLVAHVVLGPPRGGARGDQGEEAGTGTSSGAGRSPEAAGSGSDEAAAGTGINIEGRST